MVTHFDNQLANFSPAGKQACITEWDKGKKYQINILTLERNSIWKIQGLDIQGRPPPPF